MTQEISLLFTGHQIPKKVPVHFILQIVHMGCIAIKMHKIPCKTNSDREY